MKDDWEVGIDVEIVDAVEYEVVHRLRDPGDHSRVIGIQYILNHV